ncbi:MAG: YggU family protein [Myxococcales bacterium]|nr:YggU family protein [Myxococcales bacterium]
MEHDAEALWACLRSDGDGARLEVLVAPKASRNALVGVHDGRLKVQIKAPPVDGAANETLVRFLAKQLDLPRSAVSLVAGQTSRRKTVRLPLEVDELARRLLTLL